MSATNKLTLLLIDDDPAMVRLLTALLERSLGDKIEIESFTDPTAAERRLGTGEVDILLTDLEMPELNGLELLRCAKKRNAATQVLLLTGHSTHEALLNALELGAADYLLKPVDEAALIELVGQAHGRAVRWRRTLVETWRRKRKSVTGETPVAGQVSGESAIL